MTILSRLWDSGMPKITAQEKFWTWFAEHEAQILDFEADRERLFDQLAIEIQKLDPHLTFEFGPKGIRREFVISAGGRKDSFPAVTSLLFTSPSRSLLTAPPPLSCPTHTPCRRDTKRRDDPV
jgi:hypothetical protein